MSYADAGFVGKNIHSQHRFLQVYLSETDDTLTADIDVYPGRRHEVRWRFGGLVASCASAEAAEAAFRLALIGTRFESSQRQSAERSEK